MKNIFKISGGILLVLSIFLIHSCKKDKPTPPTITTTTVIEISYTTATSGGEVTNEGEGPIISRGVCWNTSADPTIDNSTTIEVGGLGSFTSNITQLSPNTMYYVKAYATNRAGSGYGNQISFITKQIVVPTLSTTEVTGIAQNWAMSGGTIEDDGGGSITSRGICWSTSPNPTISNNKTESGSSSGIGRFMDYASGLTASTTYYLRAYATNSSGTSYGNEVVFTTTSVMAPEIITTIASSVTQTHATSGGIIINDGGISATTRGICWSTSPNPTVSNDRTENGSGTGMFISLLNGLTPFTTYYLKAYVTNSLGSFYGNEVIFTTTSVTLPILTTATASLVTQTSARCGGNISSDGGFTITGCGVCWNTSTNPTISDFKTTDHTETGIFTSSMTNLQMNTKYYVRAYATSNIGTSYGSEVVFATKGVTGKAIDIEGRSYSTIEIGTQVWMGENLRTKKYNDGEAILYDNSNEALGILNAPTYCWYNNDEAGIIKPNYGALYNWYAVNTGKLCPTGWHVPTDDEWTTLINYLGGEGVAGGKLKETNYWIWPNTGATNETGFTALPGGTGYLGSFYGNGDHGFWWSSTAIFSYLAWGQSMNSGLSNVEKISELMKNCMSIRCIKDN